MKLKQYVSQGSKAHVLKPFIFPEGFILVIDTREQRPLFIERPPKGLVMVRDGLRNGDYSIRGFEDKFFIERKYISDLIPYLARDHKQTREKLSRCRDYEFMALVIEEDERKLLTPDPTEHAWANIKPENIRQALCALEIRYDMHIYYSKRKADCERWVLDRAIKFFNVKKEF
jgi:ERCC4-type nuclease